MEQSSKERVAKKETTDEATDVRLEHWGRGTELNGDKDAGLEKHVEAPDDAEPSYTEVAAFEKPSQGMGNECQPGQFTCLGQTPSFINWDGYCELCGGHLRNCWDKNISASGLVKCKGKTCQYDTLLEVSLDMDH